MRYTFLLYSDPAEMAGMTKEDGQKAQAAMQAYIGALNEAGVFKDTDWLQPAAMATTLSLKGGKKQVQDGPFAETKEKLGGFFVIDVPDLDVALEWAEKCPIAHYGKVEIRGSQMPS